MADLLWCALSGFIAGACVSAPVWLWAMARERQRAQEFRRLAREAWRCPQEDDTP